MEAGQRGRPMSAHFSCMFGKVRVTGLYDTSLGALRCLTPPFGQVTGPVLVRVSWNDEQYHLVTGSLSAATNVLKNS